MNFLLLCNYTFKEINKTKHIKQITEQYLYLLIFIIFLIYYHVLLFHVMKRQRSVFKTLL